MIRQNILNHGCQDIKCRQHCINKKKPFTSIYQRNTIRNLTSDETRAS